MNIPSRFKQEGNFETLSRSSNVSSNRLSSAALKKRSTGHSVYNMPFVKKERFNEEFDSKSVGKQSMLNAKSLSTLNRNKFKMPEQRSNAGSTITQSVKESIKIKDSSSIFTKSVIKRAAEQHRKKILEVVNNLNDDELEKISEMLRQSEVVEGERADGEAMPEII